MNKTYPLLILSEKTDIRQVHDAIAAANVIALLYLAKPGTDLIAMHAAGKRWMISDEQFIRKLDTRMILLLRWNRQAIITLCDRIPGVRVATGTPGSIILGTCMESIKIGVYTDENGTFADFAI